MKVTLGSPKSGWSLAGGSSTITSEPAPATAARLQRLLQRGLVHHRAPARIDEYRARLHQRELARADQVPGPIVERHVQAHHVRAAQQLVQQHEAHAEGVLLRAR